MKQFLLQICFGLKTTHREIITARSMDAARAQVAERYPQTSVMSVKNGPQYSEFILRPADPLKPSAVLGLSFTLHREDTYAFAQAQ